MTTRAWLTDRRLASASALVLALLLVEADAAAPVKCPKESGSAVLIAHETDCSKYYVCNGGQKFLQECPLLDDKGNRLHFNPDLPGCDWPEVADCKLPNQRSAVRKFKIATTCPAVNPVNETVHVAHETDCTKFYKCDNGKKYTVSCPAMDNEGNKLYFNPALAQCDWPWNVECKHVRPLKRYEIPDEVPTECPKSGTEIYAVHLAHENDCTKFYKCNHGEKVEMVCPVMDGNGNRLHFNAVLQVCDWPDSANCTVNFPCMGQCPEKNEGYIALLPHKTDCTKYCLCNHGSHDVLSCLPGLHFNVISGVCDDSKEAKCELSVFPPPSVPMVSPSLGCTLTCPRIDPMPPSVVYQPNENCNMFCKCNRGRGYALNCPPGLHFDPHRIECVVPEKARCSNSAYGTRQGGLAQLSGH